MLRNILTRIKLKNKAGSILLTAHTPCAGSQLGPARHLPCAGMAAPPPGPDRPGRWLLENQRIRQQQVRTQKKRHTFFSPHDVAHIYRRHPTSRAFVGTRRRAVVGTRRRARTCICNGRQWAASGERCSHPGFVVPLVRSGISGRAPLCSGAQAYG